MNDKTRSIIYKFIGFCVVVAGISAIYMLFDGALK